MIISSKLQNLILENAVNRACFLWKLRAIESFEKKVKVNECRLQVNKRVHPSLYSIYRPGLWTDFFLLFPLFIHSHHFLPSFLSSFFKLFLHCLFSFLLSCFLLSNDMNWLPDNDLQYLCDDRTYMNCCPHLTKHKPAKRKSLRVFKKHNSNANKWHRILFWVTFTYTKQISFSSCVVGVALYKNKMETKVSCILFLSTCFLKPRFCTQ